MLGIEMEGREMEDEALAGGAALPPNLESQSMAKFAYVRRGVLKG
jgi:hypothetical protein